VPKVISVAAYSKQTSHVIIYSNIPYGLFSDGSSPLFIYNKSNEMQENSRIQNKPLY